MITVLLITATHLPVSCFKMWSYRRQITQASVTLVTCLGWRRWVINRRETDGSEGLQRKREVLSDSFVSVELCDLFSMFLFTGLP